MKFWAKKTPKTPKMAIFGPPPKRACFRSFCPFFDIKRPVFGDLQKVEKKMQKNALFWFFRKNFRGFKMKKK